MENISSEEITVQVNDDSPLLISLPKAANLTEIRNILSERYDIKMGPKTYFVCPKDGSPTIPYHEEKKYSLENIINLTKNLKIKGELEPNWKEIIEKNKLECGLFFTDDGPRSAEEKAFEIVQYPKTTLLNQIASFQEIECKTEKDDFCTKNLFVVANLDVNSHIPISAKFGAFYQKNSIKHSANVKLNTYRKSKKIKAIFSMSESEVKPTKEFISAVNKALESDYPREFLKKVTEKFGQFWCKKLEIGGSILYVKKEESNVKENIRREEKSIDGAIKFGKYEGTNQMNAATNKYSYFQIRGGLEKDYHKGMAGWFTSLEDYKTWEVAAYSDIHSIFDILDDERRKKVAEVFGKRIIDSRVVKLVFLMDISRPDPYIYELPIKYDLSNCQIFVTEMKDDNNSDTIFASRVHYINDKDPPVILLHRFGSLNKRPKIQKFSIKLGWIVLGTSTMLNLPNEPIFESGESPITVKDNKHCSATISLHELGPNESLLATCVSRSRNFLDDCRESKYITRSHFVYNNSSIKACAFFYDLISGKQFYQLDDLNTHFSINYSIIIGQQNDEFGQAQINVTSDSVIKNPFNQTRYKICFENYNHLTSQHENDQFAATSSTHSTQSCLQNPIFVNLIMDKCSERRKCPHGVLNPIPEHVQFKSIHRVDVNNEKIAYFRQFNLALYNLNFAKNEIEALIWLQKSAENRNTRAQFILNKCYKLLNKPSLHNIKIRSNCFITLKEINIQHERINLSQGINIRKHQVEQAFQPAIDFDFIASEQLAIEIDIQTLKPTRKLSLAIDEALKSNAPIESLKLVLEDFGHFFPIKIILGNKLQRITQLNLDENANNMYLANEFDEFSNFNIDKSLEKWKENIQQFDSSYMIEMDGDPIDISQIHEWFEKISNQYSEWHIVKRVVKPLYEILDINQQRDIKSLFKKEERILMNNKTLISDCSTGYQRIDFDNQLKLKSNNYQLFGIIVSCDGEKLENVYMRFSLKTVYGFSVSWHDFRANDKMTPDSLQTPHMLHWILIGRPSEIGYFDPMTRNISVKIGVTALKYTCNTIIQPVHLEVGKSLFRKNIVIFDVEYTPLPKHLFFNTKIEKWNEDGSIQIKIQEESTCSKLLDEDHIFIKVRWCVLFLENDIDKERLWNHLGESL
ncbi:13213_t:CDS:10 [Ambispora leptoticha]|uniref:13213_t:CDS:1 n=1 Tax=Ambispora leptoticha TaxID=144679 RepID=A0A9N9B1M8_9GLOM|nr:13213_t:CDS:10 [Ambispora leptoticha]